MEEDNSEGVKGDNSESVTGDSSELVEVDVLLWPPCTKMSST